MERWLRWVPLLCLLGWVPLARADAFELTWQAPADCPDGAKMRARITQLIAGDDVSAQALKAVGRIERRAGQWQLSLALDVRGRHATRELRDSDCASLSEAAAWLVSVAIDPHLAPPTSLDTAVVEDEKAAAAPAPPAADTPAPQPPPPAAPAKNSAPDQAPADEDAVSDDATTATSARWPLHLRANLFGGAFAGGLAGVAASAGAEAGIEIGRLSLAILGAHHFERSRALSAPRTRADFSSFELGLEGCFQWGDALRIGPCALVSALRTAGSTVGVTNGPGGAFIWATGGASINARYLVFSPLELSLDGGLWVPISSRPRFEVENLSPAVQAAGLGGRVRLGVGLRLP